MLMQDPLALSLAASAPPEAGQPLSHANLPFGMLFDAMPDAVLLVDPLGQILHTNEQAVALFGYPADELIGQPVELLVPQRFRAEHPRHRAAWLLNPAPRVMSARANFAAMRKDGTEIAVDIALKPCRANGRLYILAAVRDTRDRRRLEDQLKNFQQAQSLSRFAGSVAHDFQNHLAVISAMAHLLRDELPQGSPLQRAANDLLEAIDRASQSTREMLLQRQTQDVKPAAIDLNEFLERMRGVLMQIVGERIDLALLPASAPCPVLIDAERLEQVVMNLVTNARDAMPHGGCLTISVGHAEPDDSEEILGAGRQTAFARISVADTGCGIDQQTRLKIFEPFFSTKTPGSGSGLGLAIVNSIVKQHSGCVSVQSEPGRGSVFNVYLPLYEPREASAAAGNVPSGQCPAA
jgi:PAS domain S-box-containing protein